MEKDSQKQSNLKVKEKIEILQGILNILRDSSIFSIFLLLVLLPQFMYRKLVDAGFVKGQIAGFTWEKQFEKTDGKLIEAAKQIDNLKKDLEKSNNIIREQYENPKKQDSKIEEQLNRNKETIQQVYSINTSIQSTLKENTPLLSPKVNAEISSLIGIVNEYKIQIFYNESKSNQKNVALEIKSALEKTGVKSTIQVLAQPPQIDKASTDQIRYFAADERDVAFALQNILNESYSKSSFKLQTVYTPSPGSVSIFLKS
jgi:septal ring factor EnvC (AmiA/AmiB activator)